MLLSVQMVTTYLQKYGEWDFVIFALIVIAMMRFHMGGLESLIRIGWRRLTRSNAASGTR